MAGAWLNGSKNWLSDSSPGRNLETATTAATESAAGTASAAKSGTARASWCGSHHLARAQGHLVEAIHEAQGIECGSAGGLIPGRLLQHAVEGADPFLLHAQGHGKRQKFLKGVGRRRHAGEAIGFDVTQEIFEAQS